LNSTSELMSPSPSWYTPLAMRVMEATEPAPVSMLTSSPSSL
jgi:hypothetical protein